MDKEQLSLEEAIRLSLLKWESIAKWGNEDSIPDECEELSFHCGFCERWGYTGMYLDPCVDCEFGKVCGQCCVTDSLWDQFSEADSNEDEEKVKVIAKEIIKLIKTIK